MRSTSRMPARWVSPTSRSAQRRSRRARVLREAAPAREEDSVEEWYLPYRERLWVRVDRPAAESEFMPEPLCIGDD